MRNILNVFLFLVLVAVLIVNWLIHRDPAQRNYEVMAEMVNSAAFKSQSDNTVVPGGPASLLPVPGTVARGSLPLHYAATPEDAIRAGEELESPVPAGDAKALDRGAAVYSTFCSPCHGAGKGDGAVATRGFPPPPSLFAENAMKMKDGRMFHIITYGQRNMPSYAAQVAVEDRWKAIAYVRALQEQFVRDQKQQAAVPPTAAQTAPTAVPPAAGEKP